MAAKEQQSVQGMETPIEGLRSWDGRYISWSQIEEFFEKEAPERFPGLWDFSIERDLKGLLKILYIALTLRERNQRAREMGKRFHFHGGGFQPPDPYYAAGIIPQGPGSPECRLILERNQYAMTRLGKEMAGTEDLGRCQASIHAAARTGDILVDKFEPFVGQCCYTGHHNYRAFRDVAPMDYVDQPSHAWEDGERKEHVFRYLVHEIRAFFRRIEDLYGIRTTDEQKWEAINQGNALRKKLAGLTETQLFSSPPPARSLTFFLGFITGADWAGDPVMAGDALDTLLYELRQRAAGRQKAAGVADDAVKLCIAGVPGIDFAVYDTIDEVGGSFTVFTTGLAALDGSAPVLEEFFGPPAQYEDPCEQIASQLLRVVPAQQAHVQAAIVRKMLRELPIQGVLQCHGWGCRVATLPMKMIGDVCREAGVPVLVLETNLVGENRGQHRTRLEAFMEMIRSREM